MSDSLSFVSSSSSYVKLGLGFWLKGIMNKKGGNMKQLGFKLMKILVNSPSPQQLLMGLSVACNLIGFLLFFPF